MIAALRALLGVAFACAAAAPAYASQNYPVRPVRIIVPFPPGGGVDTVARILGQALTARLAQQVVIDNRGGSGGLIATEIAARASADGYTLLFCSAGFAIAPHLYRKPPYDALRDFAPVVLVGAAPYLLVVHPAVAARSVRELIALAKAQPGRLNYASAGRGSALHLTAELFKALAGVEIVHVPYKGSAPALADLLSGQVQMTFNPAAVVLPHVRAGRLRALAVSGAARTQLAPELPTVAEAGVPGFEASGWYGVLGPARMPAAIVRALNREVAALLEEKEFRERLAAVGVEPLGGGPERFAAFIVSELAKWGEAVRLAGARID